MNAAATATGWYVYGIADADADLEHVRLIRHGDLAALVGEVDLAEFGQDALPERLNDRAWLEEKVRAHEDVLQRAAAERAVVPLRFGTIYDERSDVVALLEARGDEFRDALARVRGRVELGVKVWVDRAGFEQALARDAPDGEGASAGRSYMLRRQNERRVAEEAAARLGEVAHDIHDRLTAVADEAAVNRPQPRELTGRDEQMLLNGAYLVPRGDRGLEALVEALSAEYADAGLSLEVTGPWPPHNFVDRGDGTA
jgi:hypothetical protein